MDRHFYQNLSDQALNAGKIDRPAAKKILTDPQVDLLPLLNAAYEVRKTYWDKDITIHIINNGQNGYCPEDCHYCAQAKSSQANIAEYPIKSDDEFIAEARNAYEKGAHRYCMVFAGRGPTRKRTEHLAALIKKIKSLYPIEVCVSAGLVDDEKAAILKKSGLDRLNHNLNTAKDKYHSICSTHSYQDRVNTLNAARKAGLQLCSGMILGMNETADEIIDVALELHELQVESIPVNMFVPIGGTQLKQHRQLQSDFCLRVFCAFRLLNPRAEIRVAAGRELYLKDLEVLAFYPANSLFLDGYLNTKGNERLRTFQMLHNAGFTLKSTFQLDELISNEVAASRTSDPNGLKEIHDLRPYLDNISK